MRRPIPYFAPGGRVRWRRMAGVFIVVAVACHYYFQPRQSPYSHRVTVLGSAKGLVDEDDDNHAPGNYAESETGNGCRIAWLLEEHGKSHAIVDGILGPEFQNITGINFSPDGRHYGYEAFLGNRQQAIVDGQPGPTYDSISWIHFSPAGDHVLVLGVTGGKTQIFVDGIPLGQPFDQFQEFVFSPDGTRTAYSTKTDGIQSFFVDGKSVPINGGLGYPVFSPDSRHVAYSIGREGNVQLVRDSEIAPAVQNVREIVFSPDSQHLAYVAIVNATPYQFRVFRDGQPGPIFNEISQVTYSPDSQSVVYAAKKGGESLAVWDGKPGPEFETINRVSPPAGYVGGYDLVDFSFSPDSKHLAYPARSGGVTQMVVDNQPGPPYFGSVGKLVFSPDSRHTAYPLEFVYPKPGWIARVKESIQDWAAEHFGYEGDNSDKMYMVVDGSISAQYTIIRHRYVYSPDSQHLAYAAQKDGQWHLYIDGLPGPAFECIVVGPVLRKDGNLEYLAIQKVGANENLVRVEVPDFAPGTPTAH